MEFYLYSIVLPETPSLLEVRSAECIRSAICRNEYKEFPLVHAASGPKICIGNASKYSRTLGYDKFCVIPEGEDFHVTGGQTYSTYAAAIMFCEAIEKGETIGEIRGEYTDFIITHPNEYRISFSDEFDGTELNRTVWETQTGSGEGYGKGVIWESEPPYVTVKDSVLCLCGDKTGETYHSIQVSTKNTLHYRYGYAEIRARNPEKGAGIVPAFWMNSWGIQHKNGFSERHPLLEIDGYEIFGNNAGIAATLHEWYDDDAGNPVHHQDPIGRYQLEPGKTFHDGFRIFGVEWTPEQIAFYLDGREYCRVMTDNEKFHYCHEPVCLIFSNQVGLTSFGAPNDQTPWPARYEIDWIHLYQRDGEGQLYTKQNPFCD